MEAVLSASSGCCLKTKLSQRMSQRDGSDCLLRDELWLCSVVRPTEMDEGSFCARCWAVSYCLTWDLTHLGSRGTRQTNNTFSRNTQSLSCSVGSGFIYTLLCLGYFKMDPCHALPVPPEAGCAPPSASCRLSGHSQPSGACELRLFPCFPSHSTLPRPAGGAG